MASIEQVMKERLIKLEKQIALNFRDEDWRRLGLFIEREDIILGHPRLLKALNYGDDDYPGAVIDVLWKLAAANPSDVARIEEYLSIQFGSEATYISAKESSKRFTFFPSVFDVTDVTQDESLVALMIPFSKEFEPIMSAVKSAAESCHLRCQTANDLWSESVIAHEIFSLIVRAQIVVADFTGRNPNVMYEIGIAHTLGKIVIPITQNIVDMPFDIRHHRALTYLPNREGLNKLRQDLESILRHVRNNPSLDSLGTESGVDDDIPF